MGFTLEQITGETDSSDAETVETKTETEDLSFADKARLTLEGLTLNFGGEALGGIRSIISRAAGGDLSYEDALKEENDILESARSGAPGESMAYEIGGAALPSVISMIFSAGSSTPAVLANIARIASQFGLKKGAGSVLKTAGKGAVEGFTAGVGAGEGDLIDRATDTKTLLSTGIGTTAGPAVQGLVKVAGKGISKIANLDVFRKKIGGLLGKAETDELIRIIDESGIEPEEIIRRVSEGEVIADMSPELAMSLRALYSTAGKGRGEIATTLTRRMDTSPAKASATLQKNLAPGEESGNILKWFGKSEKNLKKQEGDAYNKIFNESRDNLDPDAARLLYTNLNREVVEIVQTQKDLLPKISALLQATKQKPLFKVSKTGNVTMLRDVDLETSEIIRRALDDQASENFQKGSGAMGTALSDLEGSLRTVIDDAAPALAATRAQWAKIMARSRAFDDGKKILSKSADEVELLFENLVAKGDGEAIAAFRAGYASALRNKKTVSGQTTLFRNMNDVSRKERLVLETIYPGEQLDDVVKQINLADRAIKTVTRVLGGSPTAPQQAATKKIGSMSLLANVADIFMRPLSAPFAAMRILRDFAGSKMDNLSQEQRTEVAKMLVSEDPTLLEKMLTDKTVLGKISQKYNSIIDNLGSTARRATATTSAVDVQRGESRALNSIGENISESTRKKLLAIGNR